jgi:hypothetical protein
VKENFWVSRYFGRTVPLVHDYWPKNILRFFAFLKEKLWSGSLGDKIESKLKNIQIHRHKKNIGDLPNEASIVVSDPALLLETLEKLESHQEGVSIDSAQHLSPRFTRVGLVAWIPIAKKKKAAALPKKRTA